MYPGQHDPDLGKHSPITLAQNIFFFCLDISEAQSQNTG